MLKSFDLDVSDIAPAASDGINGSSGRQQQRKGAAATGTNTRNHNKSSHNSTLNSRTNNNNNRKRNYRPPSGASYGAGSSLSGHSSTSQPLEVHIPITASFEKSHHHKSQLHHLLKTEFATRYLNAIHVDPTEANIARFMKRMPRYVSFIRKGSGDDRYLVLKLLGGHQRMAPGATTTGAPTVASATTNGNYRKRRRGLHHQYPEVPRLSTTATSDKLVNSLENEYLTSATRGSAGAGGDMSHRSSTAAKSTHHATEKPSTNTTSSATMKKSNSRASFHHSKLQQEQRANNAHHRSMKSVTISERVGSSAGGTRRRRRKFSHQGVTKSEQHKVFKELKAAIMASGRSPTGANAPNMTSGRSSGAPHPASSGRSTLASGGSSVPSSAEGTLFSRGSTPNTHTQSQLSHAPGIRSMHPSKSTKLGQQIEPFESYSKRFLYPYNLMEQLKTHKASTQSSQQNTPGDITSFSVDQISKLENDFSRSIFQLVHNLPPGIKQLSQMDTANTQKRSPSTPHKLRRSTSPTRLSSPGNSNNTISYSYANQDGLLPKDHLSYHPPEELRKRFSTLFEQQPPGDTRSDMEIIFDKELEKPPYIERSEIKALQEQFTNSFPFHLWDRKLPPDDLNTIRRILFSLKLTDFIKKLAVFCYWTFLGEFGLEKYKTRDLETQFLDVYEEVLHLVTHNKQKQARQVVELPIILLCIRVCCESIYQMCYPNFWPSVFGKNLAKRMEILITFLLDPQYYVSNLAPIQSTIDARKLEKQYLKQMKQNGSSMNKHLQQNKQNLVSPLVKFILQDPRSLGARKLLSTDSDFALGNSVIHQLFDHSDSMRARLLSIMMNMKIKQPSDSLSQGQFRRGGRQKQHHPGRHRLSRLPSLFD